MPKPKQYQRRKPIKAKRATKNSKPNGIRAMLAEFKATHPVTGRIAGVDSYNQFRRDFFRVLHGLSVPTDHAREALNRIDLAPAEFIADVRRQLADKRGLSDPRAIAGIAESDVESAIDGAISDVVAYLTEHEAKCPECFPLPDELDAAKPKQAQRILRDHLRRVIDSRADDARYQARRFHDADALLQALDDYGAFMDRCREADFSDAEIAAEAVWILDIARDAMKDVPKLADGLPNPPTLATAPASVRYHRELLEEVRATMGRTVPGAPTDLLTIAQAADLIVRAERTILRAIKGERIVKGKCMVRDEWKTLKSYRVSEGAEHLVSRAELLRVFPDPAPESGPRRRKPKPRQ
jgi:hypothetical protein